MTLLELLVGIAIGLLVIAAAIGTLVLSRGAAGTVSDISQLQQQASFALRVIGEQLRQVGVLELKPLSAGVPRFTFDDFVGVVPGVPRIAVTGTDDVLDTITVGNQPSSLGTLQRDCIWAKVTGLPNNMGAFTVNNGSLMCAGKDPLNPQPVIGNVAGFQVSYRVNGGTSTAPSFRLLTASQMATSEHWRHVQAIEVCLDLQGSEPTPDAGATYLNCQGVTTARNGRIHFVSRNVFDLRHQDVLETPLW